MVGNDRMMLLETEAKIEHLPWKWWNGQHLPMQAFKGA